MRRAEHSRRARRTTSRWALGALVAVALQTGAWAQTPGSSEGDSDYTWNAMQGEKLQALAAKGDATRGEITFEICQGCHRKNALGRPDGSYPRLAGQ
ncbi:MAG: hypothetical protein LC119_13810, partial [Burkholderiales bacterium]|nr:hypothetical protein [Burkholderiales bacterium]